MCACVRCFSGKFWRCSYLCACVHMAVSDRVIRTECIRRLTPFTFIEWYPFRLRSRMGECEYLMLVWKPIIISHFVVLSVFHCLQLASCILRWLNSSRGAQRLHFVTSKWLILAEMDFTKQSELSHGKVSSFPTNPIQFRTMRLSLFHNIHSSRNIRSRRCRSN